MANCRDLEDLGYCRNRALELVLTNLEIYENKANHTTIARDKDTKAWAKCSGTLDPFVSGVNLPAVFTSFELECIERIKEREKNE